VLRTIVAFLGFACLLLADVPLQAAPKDAEAKRNISKTIDEYAEDTNADKAEQALMEVIGNCGGSDCEPKYVALAWMYIGLVRGAANDFDTARESFTVAVGFDPEVKLDPRFATPTLQALFDGVKGKTASEQAAPEQGKKKALTLGSELKCVPLIKEVESLRPVPLQCTTAMTGVTQVAALFRQYGAEKWTRADLKKQGDAFVGELPCTELVRTGVWGMYFEARNKRGDVVDTVGTVERPVVFKVALETAEPPPALPGQAAPERCSSSSYCPEDMVGTPACDALMAKGPAPTKTLACTQATDCDWGMACQNGTCEPAGLCSTNRDCSIGNICQNGRCALDLSKARPGQDDSGLRDWFGVHFAMDFTSLSAAADVCSEGGGYNCFADDTAYRGAVHPEEAGAVGSGFHSSTMRALLTYERFVTDEISLGARVGFAFGGAPEDFFPLHFEARGTYYFGPIPESRVLFVPFVALGVGAAQVDSKASATIVECREGAEEFCTSDPPAPVNTGFLDPMSGGGRLRTIDAYKTLGKAFIVVSPGARFLLADNLAVMANLGLMLMTEEEQSSSVFLTLQPSVGANFGF
jgi:hypothetical protein